jgi:hypothetical protein
MRHLVDLLLSLALVAIATTIGVLILTHPSAVNLRAGLPLDIVAVVTSFVVYGALEDLTSRLWPAEPEPEPTDA